MLAKLGDRSRKGKKLKDRRKDTDRSLKNFLEMVAKALWWLSLIHYRFAAFPLVLCDRFSSLMSSQSTRTVKAMPWAMELAQAAQWWRKQLASEKAKAALSQDALAKFENTLCSLLEERLEGHWHLDNPVRGQAHRCVPLPFFVFPLALVRPFPSGFSC